MGGFVQAGLKRLFPNYDLTATSGPANAFARRRITARPASRPTNSAVKKWLAQPRRCVSDLVPAYLVTFAYFLVLIVGRLFVSERQQGTMTRLRAAPLSRFQILAGNFCRLIFLGAARRVSAFGRQIRVCDELGTTAIVACAGRAHDVAIGDGLALLVAAMAKTESQVAIYGTLVVLALAGASGSLLGDRELMPAAMQRISLVHAASLGPGCLSPTLGQPRAAESLDRRPVLRVLTAFGIGMILVGWKMPD